ncbi:hypothetical protein AAH524_004379 [Salmonella enterica]|nr:hypothetical protein [Salmonella enterica]
MLRTEPAALSLPGPFGAAGFHPRLSQRQRQACCDRSGHAALFTRRIPLLRSDDEQLLAERVRAHLCAQRPETAA